METDLVKVIQESGVEESTATTLQQSFMPIFEKANEWAVKAKALVVTDASQKAEMKMARTARLALREIRIEADKTRKTLKEDSLRYGKAVQGVYNVVEYFIKPIEDYLDEQEHFVEIQQAKNEALLQEERTREVQQYAEFIPYGLNYGKMTEEDYTKLLSGAKLQKEQKEEAERLAEQKRIEDERIKAMHDQRKSVLIEYWQLLPDDVKTMALGTLSTDEWNLLLKDAKDRKEASIQERLALEAKAKEAEEERKKYQEELREQARVAEEDRRKREAIAKEEKEKYEASLAAEKLAAENKAKAERAKYEAEEAKRVAAEKKLLDIQAKERSEQEAAKRLLAAPDIDKMRAFSEAIKALPRPQVSDPKMVSLLSNVEGLLSKVTDYIVNNL